MAEITINVSHDPQEINVSVDHPDYDQCLSIATRVFEALISALHMESSRAVSEASLLSSGQRLARKAQNGPVSDAQGEPVPWQG